MILSIYSDEREGKGIQPISPINKISKRKVHDGFIGIAQTLGEGVPDYENFGFMIIVRNTVIGGQGGNFIPYV